LSTTKPYPGRRSITHYTSRGSVAMYTGEEIFVR